MRSKFLHLCPEGLSPYSSLSNRKGKGRLKRRSAVVTASLVYVVARQEFHFYLSNELSFFFLSNHVEHVVKTLVLV